MSGRGAPHCGRAGKDQRLYQERLGCISTLVVPRWGWGVSGVAMVNLSRRSVHSPWLRGHRWCPWVRQIQRRHWIGHQRWVRVFGGDGVAWALTTKVSALVDCLIVAILVHDVRFCGRLLKSWMKVRKWWEGAGGKLKWSVTVPENGKGMRRALACKQIGRRTV